MSGFNWGYFAIGFLVGTVLAQLVVVPWLHRKGWL